MVVIESVSNFLTGLGAPVLLPIIIFILAVCLRQKVGKALVAALTFGVAFIGLNLIIGLLIDAIAPATANLVESTGVQMSIFDVGWPVAGAVAYGTIAGALVIPVSLGINFIMLFTKLTKTINVDIWNFWHHALVASVVTIASGGKVWLGLIAAAILAAVCLIIADRTAKRVQEFYNLPGISIPQAFAASSVPIVIGVNWCLDRIPGVKNIVWDESTIREKWGFFGNPLILGCTLGFILGAIGGLWNDLAAWLTLSITLGAVMLLMPMMVKLFVESLSSVSEAARSFFKEKFKDREIYIGLDSAILIGHPITIAAAVILIPLVLGLAIILPFNRVLPFGDLAALAYFVAMVPCLSKGNLFRSIICGLITMAVVLLVVSSFGGAMTTMAVDAGYAVPEGVTDITALSAGNWITWILYQVGRLFG
jgi:PTS system galactitol-specific IIC component